MANRALVLDALGTRVRLILEKHADNVSFFVPETAYLEAEGYLATLVTKCGGEAARALGTQFPDSTGFRSAWRGPRPL
jgi:hypothetical protein